MDRWVGQRIEWYLGCRWGVDAFLILQNNRQKPEGRDRGIRVMGLAGHQEQVRAEKASVWSYSHQERGPKEGRREGCRQPDGGPWSGTVPYQCQGPGFPASWILMLEHIESTRSSLPARAESPG